jgi:hypothetical protein
MSGVLSFRPLIEELAKEYGDIHPNANVFARVLSEMVIGLAGYQEEGAKVTPLIFFTTDLKTLLISLKGNDAIEIGEGPLFPRTSLSILKTCGPLSQNQEWAIYVLLGSTHMRYGVFRTDRFPLHESSFQRLKNFNDQGTPIIGLQKIGAYNVEIRSAAGQHHYIDPSGLVALSQNPSNMIQQWVTSLTTHVPPNLKKKMAAFHRRIAVDVLSSSHGALVAVIPSRCNFPELLSDGVSLPKGSGLIDAMQKYLKERSEAAALSLTARSNLIRKMIAMDGVTVFDTSGDVLAYNCFVRNLHPYSQKQIILGGARKRAFEILTSRMDQEIDFALYQSQDGFGQSRISKRVREA